jgi:hypothetical protein
MKAKIVLLMLYFAFVGIAVHEWRALKAVATNKEHAIAAWQRLDARKKAGTTVTTEPVPYLQAYQGMAEEAVHQSTRQRNIILISLLLTAPLALYVGVPRSRN